MKHHVIRALALAGATIGLNAGCAAQAQVSGSAEAEAPVVFVAPPTLVAVDANVWVVRDADYATYYVDDCYWVYRDGAWYRSRDYAGGWAVVEVSVVPPSIAARNPAVYVHYRGEATARTRSAPRGDGVARDERAEGNPHGGPPGHDEVPGVGNQRKAEGEQPGNAHEAQAAKVEDRPEMGNPHKASGSPQAAAGDADRGDKTENKKDNKKDNKKGANKKK
jgi:hypothetical protein